ncbi:MAG: hypothetical protein OIF40_14760 [Mangrovicoccus sp.]|nr:hypothetical protein [Mangrovicoccus sp.]
MGVYNATTSWVRIANGATSASIESAGDVTVYTGSAAPSSDLEDAGVSLSGGAGLYLWDVPGGRVFIKGSGQVRLLVSPASAEA